LETFAYDPHAGAVPPPSPSSKAVATTEPGDGQMIGESSRRQRGSSSEANVVLNLSSVPLQQATKTVLRDMVGEDYVVDPGSMGVDGVVSVQTTQPVNKADALELFQAALAPIGAVLVQRHLPDRTGRPAATA
jgi:general secretion pathway protein D